MTKIYLLHGPNLNLLGQRQTDIYGLNDLKSIENSIFELSKNSNLELDSFQTNSEGDLIDKIHQIYQNNDGDVIINPGAFTHYSYGLGDAVAMLKDKNIKVIEVHISNPHTREKFRHNSVISQHSTGTIAGLGILGYKLAFEYLSNN